jgi:hypothetical protein
MSTKRRDTSLETTGLCAILPIYCGILLRRWSAPSIASLERAKIQHNDKRRLDESDPRKQEGEGGVLAALLLLPRYEG